MLDSSRYISETCTFCSKCTLPSTSNSLEFIAEKFVAHKTNRSFSFDQAHEQANAIVKGDGGAVGLTENPNALQRWMFGGPEISRMVAEFEDGTIHGSTKHHEQTTAV